MEVFKEKDIVRNHVRNIFSFMLPMKQESLLAKLRDGKMFRNIQCLLEVPDGLKFKFSNFLPILKKVLCQPSKYCGLYERKCN